MRLVSTGVTRAVLVGSRFAIKVPRLQVFGREAGVLSIHSPFGWFLRGWLANRSEWVQRDRPGVNPPVLTLGYVVQVYPAADEVLPVDEDPPAVDFIYAERHARGGHLNADEMKGSSWGRFGSRWLLIDFDRAWEEPRGLIGGLYYAHQERLAMKWMDLPCACPDPECEGKVV